MQQSAAVGQVLVLRLDALGSCSGLRCGNKETDLYSSTRLSFSQLRRISS